MITARKWDYADIQKKKENIRAHQAMKKTWNPARCREQARFPVWRQGEGKSLPVVHSQNRKKCPVIQVWRHGEYTKLPVTRKHSIYPAKDMYKRDKSSKILTWNPDINRKTGRIAVRKPRSV